MIRSSMGFSRQLMRVAATVMRDGTAPLFLARKAIREYGAMQRTWELQALVGLVRRRRPSVIVELGTHRGGTLVCWAAVARATAHIVSIDMICQLTGLGARDEDLSRVRQRLGPSQTLTAIDGDSHAPETLARLREALAGAPIDVLWIDADHSYDGVKQDLEMYAPLVRPGGIVALHDVHGSSACPRSQAHVFWQEIKPRYRTREFIADPRPGGGMGIGVIYVGRGQR
jgi:cephalosporin hydroxylase